MPKSGSLRRLRQNAGLTLEQLSERTGRSFGHVAAIERGERPASPEMVEQILSALQLLPPPNSDDAVIADSGTPSRALIAEHRAMSKIAHDVLEEIEDAITVEDRAPLVELLRYAITRCEAINAMLDLRSRPPA